MMFSDPLRLHWSFNWFKTTSNVLSLKVLNSHSPLSLSYPFLTTCAVWKSNGAQRRRQADLSLRVNGESIRFSLQFTLKNTNCQQILTLSDVLVEAAYPALYHISHTAAAFGLYRAKNTPVHWYVPPGRFYISVSCLGAAYHLFGMLYALLLYIEFSQNVCLPFSDQTSVSSDLSPYRWLRWFFTAISSSSTRK